MASVMRAYFSVAKALDVLAQLEAESERGQWFFHQFSQDRQSLSAFRKWLTEEHPEILVERASLTEDPYYIGLSSSSVKISYKIWTKGLFGNQVSETIEAIFYDPDEFK